MANPALKNGYLSIAIELVEHLSGINIPGNEMRIIWVVWRKTWGWQSGDRKKDWDLISLSQFEKLADMKRANVADALKSLVVKRLLLKSEKGYKFNQNYDEWVVVKRLPPSSQKTTPPKGSSQKHTKRGSQKTTEGSSQKTTHNRYPIEIIDTNKNSANFKEESPPQEKIVDPDHLNIVKVIDAFRVFNKDAARWYAMKNQRESIKRLIKNYEVDRVLLYISWLPRTNEIVYFPNINTPIQLESKWSQFEYQVKKAKNEKKAKDNKNPGFVI